VTADPVGNERSTNRYRWPGGDKLVTLEDAGNCITKLPKAEHEAPEWQAAMDALILVATLGGPTMFAWIWRHAGAHPRVACDTRTKTPEPKTPEPRRKPSQGLQGRLE
jgi:hypothetical protein